MQQWNRKHRKLVEDLTARNFSDRQIAREVTKAGRKVSPGAISQARSTWGLYKIPRRKNTVEPKVTSKASDYVYMSFQSTGGDIVGLKLSPNTFRNVMNVILGESAIA